MIGVWKSYSKGYQNAEPLSFVDEKAQPATENNFGVDICCTSDLHMKNIRERATIHFKAVQSAHSHLVLTGVTEALRRHALTGK